MVAIEWDTQTRDFLRKLPKEIAQRIFSKVDKEVKENVEHYLETLIGREGYKIRVGECDTKEYTDSVLGPI